MLELFLTIMSWVWIFWCGLRIWGMTCLKRPEHEELAIRMHDALHNTNIVAESVGRQFLWTAPAIAWLAAFYIF